ncbi:DUF397 domain-containing protein [Micromonospora provocatoris]|uniref:DUF397 domain-containing protein n=1 Tax=Micromonospora tulbaghiae TaxID=479978 RepID=UPI000E0399A8|nr:DUF397 domain-containing protein [Micromonospora provocatoris]RBJ08502.1 DUF397 domain-containing protein [Micromonospora provocatoris]
MNVNGATWRTATRSGTSGGDCVEVADNLPGVVLVRDSKNRDGGTIHVTPSSWQAFVALAKQIGPAV